MANVSSRKRVGKLINRASRLMTLRNVTIIESIRINCIRASQVARPSPRTQAQLSSFCFRGISPPSPARFHQSVLRKIRPLFELLSFVFVLRFRLPFVRILSELSRIKSNLRCLQFVQFKMTETNFHNLYLCYVYLLLHKATIN